MAANDIKKHFKGLRADTGRRKGRADPFATGFEDDSDESKERRSRSKTQKEAPQARGLGTSANSTSSKLPSGAALLRDSEHAFLDPPKKTDRRSSPAPLSPVNSRVLDGTGRRGSLPGSQNRSLPGTRASTSRSSRSAVAQAAGNLAYLDDSSSDEDEEQRSSRANRYPSPAPKASSPVRRSSTPRGARDTSREPSLTTTQPLQHTVASAFAGTKYLQDSDTESDSEEEAVLSRNSTAESVSDVPSSPESTRLEVQRVDKPKTQYGGGVSWRAFSEGRAEQRSQEITALQSKFKQRGKSISFGSHALTDDGNRVPLQPSPEQILRATGSRRQSRGKSPPRRAEDTKPTDDELADGSSVGVYDPSQFKTNPFTGKLYTARFLLPIAWRTLN